MPFGDPGTFENKVIVIERIINYIRDLPLQWYGAPSRSETILAVTNQWLCIREWRHNFQNMISLMWNKESIRYISLQLSFRPFFSVKVKGVMENLEASHVSGYFNIFVLFCIVAWRLVFLAFWVIFPVENTVFNIVWRAFCIALNMQ